MTKKRSTEVEQIIKKFKNELAPAQLDQMRETFNRGIDSYIQ